MCKQIHRNLWSPCYKHAFSSCDVTDVFSICSHLSPSELSELTRGSQAGPGMRFLLPCFDFSGVKIWKDPADVCRCCLAVGWKTVMFPVFTEHLIVTFKRLPEPVQNVFLKAAPYLCRELQKELFKRRYEKGSWRCHHDVKYWQTGKSETVQQSHL